METGEVVKWVDDRGFGFIRPDVGGVDLFAHISDFASRDIREGDRVQFEVAVAERGPMAKQVRTI